MPVIDIWEVGTGKPEVLDYHCLFAEFLSILGYRRPCLPNKIRQNIKWGGVSVGEMAKS